MYIIIIIISSFDELMQSRGVRRPSVRLSVCLSVCPSVNLAQIASSRRQIAGSPPNSHTMVRRRARIQFCAQGQGQGQGQRSRDTDTSVMSRNVCYTVRSHVLSLHALTL